MSDEDLRIEAEVDNLVNRIIVAVVIYLIMHTIVYSIMADKMSREEMGTFGVLTNGFMWPLQRFGTCATWIADRLAAARNYFTMDEPARAPSSNMVRLV